MSGGATSSTARRWGQAVRQGWRTERAWQVLALATAVGFALRLAWVLVATREPVGYHDPLFYEHLATDLAHGHGYVGETGQPTGYYPPGYPLLLGLVYAVVLHTPLPDDLPLAGSVLNLVLGTATIALVGVLGRRLFGPWAGAAAACVVALFPSLVLHTALLLTETSFIFFLVAALAVLLWEPWPDHPPGPVRLVVVGLLSGYALLIRPVALPVLAVLVVGLALGWTPWRQWLGRAALLALGVAVVVIPWTVRNAVVLDAFVPISTNTGDNLCIGNHDGARGGFSLPDACFEGVPPFPQAGGDVERNRETTARALTWIRAHPLEQVPLVWWRTYYTFVGDDDALHAVESYGEDPWIGERRLDALATISDAYFFGALVLAGVGVVAVVGRGRPRTTTLVLTMVALVTATWWTFGDVRFHVPLNPLLALPAGVVLASVPALRRRVAARGAP